MNKELIWTQDHTVNFSQSLNLDIQAITADGKYKKNFELFWDLTFQPESNLLLICSHLEKMIGLSQSGPVRSWLLWLRDNFHLYVFFNYNLSLKDFVSVLSINEGHFIFCLRNFLYQQFPHKEQDINTFLSFGDYFSSNRNLNSTELLSLLKIENLEKKFFDEEMMSELEVSIFPVWGELTRYLTDLQNNKKVKLTNQNHFINMKIIGRGLIEGLFFLLIFVIGIWAFKYSSSLKEKIVMSKIQIFEPGFLGFESGLTYRPDDKDLRKIELSNKEIDELEKIESAKSLDELKSLRYDPETDEVSLTSVDSITQSIEEAEKSLSTFEEREKDKGGYRDIVSARGGRKAYRLIMASAAPNEIREQILPLLSEFGVEQNDNVVPGTNIPGGLYFNLIVPTKNLKLFLEKVSLLQDSTIFESTPREPMPVGKNRVFIWIKSL